MRQNKPAESSAWQIRCATVTLIITAGLTLSSASVCAYGEQPPSPAASADGTSFESTKLTGNWWGARDTLDAHGVEINFSLTQFYQGVTNGGIDSGFEYGGKLDTYLLIDGGKVGLWRGLSITTHLETRYGEDTNPEKPHGPSRRPRQPRVPDQRARAASRSRVERDFAETSRSGTEGLAIRLHTIGVCA